MYETNIRAKARTAEYDEGLRSYMLGIYNRLFGSLILTAALAYLATVPPLRDLLYTFKDGKLAGLTILGYAAAFGPILIMLGTAFAGAYRTRGGSAFVLWSTAALFGLSSGVLVMSYAASTLAMAFLITAGSFGALSLIGYTTKKDLSGMGAALIIGLFGLIALMILGMFVHIAGLQWLITMGGILIFAGLIAYDTQKMKLGYGSGDPATEANLAALDLYLDFINLFRFILSALTNND
jgi:FtsH-binding integral membrane protein